MTIWYMDYEAGTDADASVGNGDSFATRRKRIDNFVAAAIAPGDEIRIMASPAPSLVGNATWTDGPLPSAFSITSSTNDTPIVITTGIHNLTTGDTVIINGHATNTNANGVWKVTVLSSTTFSLQNADGTNSVGNGVGTGGTLRKFTNAVVTLASPVTQNIALCGNQGTLTNWVSSANVTSTVITTDYKEGGECQQIAIAAVFTTGKAAYRQITSLDLSAYQQVSFLVKQTGGAIGVAGATRLRLCTDTTGDTPVHDIPIPALGALNRWVPVVVNLGTNLNSAIQSVSFDVVTDNGGQTFLIDNIIACKAASSADSLNHTSLISKDPGDHSFGDTYECWWGIQSINGTRVVLEGTITTIPTSNPQRGYSGATETVSTYKRETVKTAAAATSSSSVQMFKDSGTAGNLISYTGGWNRTDMSTQTGETWFDGQNGFGVGLYDGGFPLSFVRFDKVSLTRYYNGFATGSATNDVSIGTMQICNTSSTPLSANGNRLTATTLSVVSCGAAITPGTAAVVQTIGRADSTTAGNGVTFGASSWTGTVKSASNNTSAGVSGGIAGYIGLIEKATGNGGSGVSLSNRASIVGVANVNSNVAYGIVSGVGSKVLGGSSSGNGSGGVQCTTANPFYLCNFTINEATEVTNFTAYSDGRVYSEKHDGAANNSVIFCDGGMIRTDATQTHGATSYSWKFSPTSTNRSQYYPLNQSIAKVAVGANSLVTISAWFRRDNTALTAKLVCKGGQISGVTSDVTASMTAAINTWEQLTITFTPTEAGVVDIEAQFYGGTAYNGWVSDLSVQQV